MQDLFQLNFISYFAACKFALPHIRKTKGNIINMGSWVGGHGQAQAPTYTATKGAITSFSKGLAIDEAEHGVRVNIVSPGWSFRVPSLLNQLGRPSRACLHGTCTLSCPVLPCAWLVDVCTAIKVTTKLLPLTTPNR
jgi:NAD(P)-dependent dehydrogenase (short-subunit alcohol dehydrogenase family)